MEGYGKYGIKTIWLDAAEPQRNSEATLYKARFAAGTDAEVGGAWVQQHTRAFADGMKSVGIEPSEYFVLPRHAWVWCQPLIRLLTCHRRALGVILLVSGVGCVTRALIESLN